MFDKDIITPLPDKNEQRIYIFVYTKRIFYEDINDKATWILRELILIFFDIQCFENLRKAIVPCYHETMEYHKDILKINFREFLDSPKLLYWFRLETLFLYSPSNTGKLDWTMPMFLV